MGGNKKNFARAGNDYYQHDNRDGGASNYKNSGNFNPKNKFSGRGPEYYQKFSSFRHGGRRGRNNFNNRNRRDFQGDVHMKDGKSMKLNFEHSGPRNRRPMHLNNQIWTKIVCKGASMFSKEEVLSAIKEYIDEPFVPFMMEVEGPNIVFYLEKSQNLARAITNLSGRIQIDGKKLVIFSNGTAPPNRKITPEQKEIIKVIMGDRYAVELSRLDLKKFYHDKALLQNEIFFPLYRRPNVECVLEILTANCPSIEELDLSHNQIMFMHDWESIKNMPNLKRLSLANNSIKIVDSLKSLKGLPIVELNLEGNPLSNINNNQFRGDAEKYKSAVREHFPKLERLDGVDLGKAITFEGEDSKLPPILPSFLHSDQVKGVALQFVEQYFQIFDSDDRKPLEAAYTEDASFSLSAKLPDSGSFFKFSRPYLNLNRNLKTVSNPDRRNSLLYRGRSAVIEALCRLPNSAHDPGSFVIDIPFAQPVLMHVVLRGIFKQQKTELLRNFMKSMVIVPVGGGFCISNEQLFINVATVDQIRTHKSSNSQSSEPSAAPSTAQASSNPLEGLLPAQIELIQKFAENSKMLPQYCKMCLEGNDWDFAKAGEMFLNLQKENKIPPEYFGMPSSS